MVSSLAELANANLLRLLLPLTFHSFHCSNEKATVVCMEVGLHEETHFAPMTELGVSHGDSGGRNSDQKCLPKASRKTPTPPGPEKMMSPAIGGKMSQPMFVPRKMKLLLFPVRSTWLASQEYPGEKNRFAFFFMKC